MISCKKDYFFFLFFFPRCLDNHKQILATYLLYSNAFASCKSET